MLLYINRMLAIFSLSNKIFINRSKLSTFVIIYASPLIDGGQVDAVPTVDSSHAFLAPICFDVLSQCSHPLLYGTSLLLTFFLFYNRLAMSLYVDTRLFQCKALIHY